MTRGSCCQVRDGGEVIVDIPPVTVMMERRANLFLGDCLHSGT